MNAHLSHGDEDGRRERSDPNLFRIADVGTLAWKADDVAYMLQASGLNLSRGDLVRIAESIH